MPFLSLASNLIVPQTARVATFLAPQMAPIKRILHPRYLSSPTSYGEGMDQQNMMESDYLIPVDRHDNPLVEAAISKRKAHEFNSLQPRGIAHRAFSVFLFNGKNELLLTQRASTKITFPNVWTNTCCSHPLTDMIPNEVDTNNEYPHFPGIKHAAIRKLRHELGIESEYVPFADFHFLTRFHYWAADTITYGPTTPWGEHEIDYILFIQCQQEPKLGLNEEEVSDHKYVSLNELKDYMYNDNETLRENKKMLFSPWFRGIMENGGFDWMGDVDGALNGKYSNTKIHYFDPPTEHCAQYNLKSHDKTTGVLDSKEVVQY
jgi:isopentenyl-diphosphate delta-isomerase